jgi:hypothetical protein
MNKVLVFFILLFAYACGSNNKSTPVYSFVSAGHVYGNPETYTSSIYPPFLSMLDSLISTQKLDLLVLTGDVVAHPTKENWETVKNEIQSLSIDKWVIAPGNHDISAYMDEHIQPFKYSSFIENGNLFLTLNTSFEGWTVDSAQQQFIQESLAQDKEFHNVFVFTHQLWWQKDRPIVFELDSIRPNSYALFEGESSFWADAFFPYFDDIKKDVYFFAGDMGCFYGLPGFYEDHYQNFHFYGSGMGGAVEDNFLKIDIFQDNSVKIQRIDF